ncbi:hypothetical protein AX16_004293 [Volvariella volvacea WC 439]|nr:hypothetical protein AX16_004293 [Volvariella volvacea WC 439]
MKKSDIWTTLDNVLAEPTFDSLKSINVKIQLDSWSEEMLDTVQVLKYALSKTAERKFLPIEAALGNGYLNEKDFPIIPQ